MHLHAEINSESRDVETGAEGEVRQIVSRLTGKVSTDKFNLDMVQEGSRLDSDLDLLSISMGRLNYSL
ncbi:translocation/assembly module TamB domain-containing protein [Oligella ureolytica]